MELNYFVIYFRKRYFCCSNYNVRHHDDLRKSVFFTHCLFFMQRVDLFHITKQMLRKQRAKTSNIKIKINLYVPTIQASIFQVWLAIILENLVKATTTNLSWENLEERVRDFTCKGKDKTNAPAIPMAKKMKPGTVDKKTTRFPGKFAQVSTFVTLSTLVSTSFLVSMHGF